MTDQTWNVKELVWSVAMAIGLLANLRLIRRSLSKRAAVIARPGARSAGPSALSAERYVRNDAGRLIFFSLGLVVGFWAMSIPEGDPLFEVAAAVLLISMGVVLLVNSIWDLADEPKMDRLLDEEDRAERERAEREGSRDVETTSLLRAMRERRRRIQQEQGGPK